MDKQKYKKGFLFTVLALVLVSFIFVSVQLWAQTQQVEETRAANNFKLEAMRTSLMMIDQNSFLKFSNASLKYALNKLALNLQNHSITLTDAEVFNRGMQVDYGSGGQYPDGTARVNNSIYEMMIYGNTSGYLVTGSSGNTLSPGFFADDSNLTYSKRERVFTLGEYFRKTAQAADLVGYNLTWGKIKNFDFNQTGPWTLQLYFKVPMILESKKGGVRVQRDMTANFSLDIHGLVDPYIMRNDIAYRRTSKVIEPDLSRPYRNIYHVKDYENYSDAKAQEIMHGYQGMGFFFGPVTTHDNTVFSLNEPVYNISKIKQWIFLTGNIAKAREMAPYFGGLIIHSPVAPQINRRTITVNDCEIYNYTEENCLFCINWATNNGSSSCSGISGADVKPHYLEDSYNASAPFTPYIIINSNGFNATKFLTTNKNFRLDTREVLIFNKNNLSDICDIDDKSCEGMGTGANPKQDYVDKILKRKYYDATSDASYSKIWDLTGPRDMAICGFYTRSDYAPSYLQRFIALDKPTSWASNVSALGFGIESFNVGKWAMGAIDDEHHNTAEIEANSQLDYHYYNNVKGVPTQPSNVPVCTGTFITGMPGCKNIDMCNDKNLTKKVGVGRFALTNKTNENPVQRYGLENITYPASYNPSTNYPFTPYATQDCR